MLKLESINAWYGKLQVLHDVSLSIAEGARVGIFGHNGAGKTSLLKCCVGDMGQCAGRVSYRGRPIIPGAVHLNVRHGIGFVPQGHNVFRELSVAENLRIAGLMHDPTYASTIYRLFPVLEERSVQIAGSLSGGQQQMLALGMALMTRPSILILDEPTTGLAPIIVRDVLESILKINRDEGTTLIFVEQNVQATLKNVDRAIVLKSGRVLVDGPSSDLLARESLWDLF